jgi:cell division protein FtsZ
VTFVDTLCEGEASGEERASTAIQKALHNPLLEDISVKDASAVLINVISGPDLTMKEVCTFLYH